MHAFPLTSSLLCLQMVHLSIIDYETKLDWAADHLGLSIRDVEGEAAPAVVRCAAVAAVACSQCHAAPAGHHPPSILAPSEPLPLASSPVPPPRAAAVLPPILYRSLTNSTGPRTAFALSKGFVVSEAKGIRLAAAFRLANPPPLPPMLPRLVLVQ
jgi:hypothetical protein